MTFLAASLRRGLLQGMVSLCIPTPFRLPEAMLTATLTGSTSPVAAYSSTAPRPTWEPKFNTIFTCL